MSPPRSATHDQLPTTELLRLTRHGDDRSTRLLCERLHVTLRRCVSGRLPTGARAVQDTDDIVQEVIATTMERLPEITADHMQGFYAYVWQIARTKIADAGRRARREANTQGELPERAGPGPSPLEGVIGRETLKRYEQALDRLTIQQQQAVVGRLEFGLSFAELADAMGKPTPDAARMVVNRALVRLAREMSEVDGSGR